MGATDAFLLDAYSQTVSGVVERAGPSVASVQVNGRPADYLFRNDTLLVTLEPALGPGQAAEVKVVHEGDYAKVGTVALRTRIAPARAPRTALTPAATETTTTIPIPPSNSTGTSIRGPGS